MFLKNIYRIVCFLYRNISTFLQIYIFPKSKKKIFNRNFVYFSYKEKNDLFRVNLDEFIYEKKNDFQSIFIFDENKIKFFIKKILNKNFRDFITNKTGFVYSIDYFSFYRNFHIPNNQMRSVYANFFHLDKPYSKNMLKIIVPISVTSFREGPLIIKKSKPLVLKNQEPNQDDLFSFLSNKKENIIYAFHPSKCFHKASVPIKDKFCTQIMMQLNPSDKWKINSKIFDKQDKQEPKFPELINIFDSYKPIA
tara:strand:- start:30817 stop:31569 length:753 start_codon:yes stop_codon:yes gene_type:complete